MKRFSKYGLWAVVVALLSVSIAVAAERDPNLDRAVVYVKGFADGGMLPVVGEVELVEFDGGYPVAVTALPAGESASDPLFCEAVSDGAAVGAANPLPVGVTGAGTAASTPLYSAPSVGGSAASASNPVPAQPYGQDMDGNLLPAASDLAGRPEVTVAEKPGACVGFNLTTSSAALSGVNEGVEYRVVALTDLWIRHDGIAATTDAPSEFLPARSEWRWKWATTPTLTGILPAGASALSGSEILFCIRSRAQ